MFSKGEFQRIHTEMHVCVCVCVLFVYLIIKKNLRGCKLQKKKANMSFCFFFFLKVYIAHILKKTWAWKNQVFNNLLRPAPLFQ